MTICAGDPPGSCGVEVVEGRIWCRVCIERRQAAIAVGLPVGLPTPLRIIVEDIDAPVLMCQCGGAATSIHHEQSLLHRTWAWATVLEGGLPR